MLSLLRKIRVWLADKIYPGDDPACRRESCPPQVMCKQAFDVLDQYSRKYGKIQSRNVSSYIDNLVYKLDGPSTDE